MTALALVFVGVLGIGAAIAVALAGDALRMSWAWRDLVARRTIVTTTDGTSYVGVLVKRRRDVITLASVRIATETDDGATFDGETHIPFERVAWIQTGG